MQQHSSQQLRGLWRATIARKSEATAASGDQRRREMGAQTCTALAARTAKSDSLISAGNDNELREDI